MSCVKSTIVNIHIPKTAGSTFRRRIGQTLPKVLRKDNLIGIDATHHRGLPDQAQLRALAMTVFDDLDPSFPKCVTGHYHYTAIADLIAARRDDLIVTTTLRDPVIRMLSDYAYSTSARHSNRDAFVERYPSFTTFLEDPVQSNKQVKYLRPFEGATVEETIEHVRQNFDDVAFTETFDADFERFVRRLGLAPAPPVRVNESPNKALIEDLLERIGPLVIQKNSDDILLYEALSAVDWGDAPFHLVVPVARARLAGRRAALSDGAVSLLREVEAHGPWHHDIDLNTEVSTGLALHDKSDNGHVSVTRPLDVFEKQMHSFFPDGMAGRSFLDCGCNAGGYCFAAKDAGADRTYGFDVRQHWIDQARFVAARREGGGDGMQFEVADLLDLEAMEEMFDVTWFSGLLYHLPDPVRGLKIAADKTRDLIVVNTAVATGPNDPEDRPALSLRFESTENVMSGVHGLAWLPSGPTVLRHILGSLGFPETKVVMWHAWNEAVSGHPNARIAMVAAREPGRLGTS